MSPMQVKNALGNLLGRFRELASKRINDRKSEKELRIIRHVDDFSSSPNVGLSHSTVHAFIPRPCPQWNFVHLGRVFVRKTCTQNCETPIDALRTASAMSH